VIVTKGHLIVGQITKRLITRSHLPIDYALRAQLAPPDMFRPIAPRLAPAAPPPSISENRL
jgi:hypothetical protein